MENVTDGQLHKKKGLIISISEYDKLERLEYCKNDGEKICHLLNYLKYEVPSNRTLIGRVQYFDMHDAIMDFFREGTSKDLMLFYFSGHAEVKQQWKSFFCIIRNRSRLTQ
jgi:hypothetical protein